MSRRTRNLDELYAAHFGFAKRFAYLLTGDQATAEDVAQDAFVRIFSRLSGLPPPASFPAYLRTTIVNLARDRGRRRERERRFLSSLRTEPSTVSFSVAVERRDEMWVALQRLPYRQRAAIVLRYYEDLSEAQTADAMGCSVGTVKSYTSRGLKTLRNQVEEVLNDA